MTPAEALARRLHAGQTDKAGRAYVGHLERVVSVGTKVRDNDPRMPRRVLTVHRIWAEQGGPTMVDAADPRRGRSCTTIRLDRIHIDGKPRKSGWSVVS